MQMLHEICQCRVPATFLVQIFTVNIATDFSSPYPFPKTPKMLFNCPKCCALLLKRIWDLSTCDYSNNPRPRYVTRKIFVHFRKIFSLTIVNITPVSVFKKRHNI